MIKTIWKLTKLSFQMIVVVLVGFAISLGVYVSVSESLRLPSQAELQSLENVSADLDGRETVAVLRSRQSILHVLSSNGEGKGFAKMSGTYMTHDDKFYVITAAHGIMGECTFTFVGAAKDEIFECIRYIIIDQAIDYAIIEIEEVVGRTPVQLEEVVPRPHEWRQEAAILNEVFYTGYPNGLGPLTFRGSVAGVGEESYLLLHSYAWPGSSGAGVFSYEGNMIGIVIALNVGFTPAGYDVLEDLVIVTPLFMIDWDTAYEIMNEPEPTGDTGDTGE